MNYTLEKLWYDCFAEECAVLDTEVERELAKKAADSGKALKGLLTEEQQRAMGVYVDTIYELQASLLKKAFLRGAEIAVSFLAES